MSDDPEFEKQVFDLAELMRHVGNEPILFQRVERMLAPRPSALAVGEEDVRVLQERVDRLVQRLGGVPSLIIRYDGKPPSVYDVYVNAIFSEALEVFHRARRAVVRAHVVFVGQGALARYPEWMSIAPASEDQEGLLAATNSRFWEHAETAYIRLASYWDRVGQVLDFVFFKIRHFERDGLHSVLDRIHLNIVPVAPRIGGLDAWKALRQFQVSESEDGLKWLSSRRNMLVHNLHLQPVVAEPEEQLFESLHNHLDVRLRKKLKPGTPKEEVDRLHRQLDRAASMFGDILALCEEHALSAAR